MTREELSEVWEAIVALQDGLDDSASPLTKAEVIAELELDRRVAHMRAMDEESAHANRYLYHYGAKDAYDTALAVVRRLNEHHDAPGHHQTARPPLKEECYWCGCVRLASWKRCQRHADLEHDEEPPTQAEERRSTPPASAEGWDEWDAALDTFARRQAATWETGRGVEAVDEAEQAIRRLHTAALAAAREEAIALCCQDCLVVRENYGINESGWDAAEDIRARIDAHARATRKGEGNA